jgi:hypothetical protein
MTTGYLVPIQMNAIPVSNSARSTSFALRFLSLKKITAHAKDMMTELRLTRDTTEIIVSGSFSEVKYAKSPMQMNREIRGMVHLHWNGVL